MRIRFILVLAATALWGVAIVARLSQLQVVRHDHYVQKARRQQQSVIELDAPRGTIYDVRGRELAVSIEVDSAWANPGEIDDPAATARALTKVLGGDGRELEARLASDREFIWVARKLDPPTAAAIRRLDLPGINFVQESKRYYPMRELAGQVLGFVGTDNHGLAGLERVYDAEIAGKAGRRRVLRDARRGLVADPDPALDDPQPGGDLFLTIDASIQHIVERELQRAIEQFGAHQGSALVLDPATGAVLAMADSPPFDPNLLAHYPKDRWHNRAIEDAYEPGSTFKVITAAAALEAGTVDPDDVIDCEMGGITLFGQRINDHKRFGLLSFREVITKSSNVGAIKTAWKLGDQRFYQKIADFRFGRDTGIDLPGESAGLLAPLKSWLPLTRAYVAFGQGIAVTPLQLANAFSAVANGGSLLRPYVVAGVRDAEGGIHWLHPHPEVLGHPLSTTGARQLERILEGVTEPGGTATAANIPGYPVAGKTGTAQSANPGEGYSLSHHVASFAGFAPARRPAIVCLVEIDGPRSAIHGGQVAAPAFAAIARQVLLYLGVPPERTPPETWPGQVAERPGGGRGTPPAPVTPAAASTPARSI